jgi:phenylpropionate dioxygenase-like ring-hydroxylating dioxygenase large terminal subunit
MNITELDVGTGYYRKPGTHNARLTEVRRGTPMGELMRRYWHPIGLAAYATDLPREVRVLGEDLILFRDKKGRPGLVHPRCAHRGSSLFYGAIEEEGIRCCYHGWLFNVQGECIERPAEPGGRGLQGTSIRQPWYPLQERYGLIWAYLGPAEKKPLLPRYNVFEELEPGEQIFTDDQNIGAGAFGVVPFNWLQHYENIHDVAHFFWLHYLHSGPQFGDRFGEIDLLAMRRDLHKLTNTPAYETNSRGVTARRCQTLPDGRELRTVVETVLPTLRVVPNPFGKEGRVDHIGFVLPVDDNSFRIFTVLRAPDRGYFDFFTKRIGEIQSMTTEDRQRKPNDLEAQGSQGPITLHSEEHLASSDKAIVMLRRLFEAQIKAVEEGRDPIGVHFEPGQEYIHVEGGSFISAPVTAAQSA